MDNSIIFSVACTNSPPAPHHSDNEWVTISTTVADSNASDCNDEKISFFLAGQLDQEWNNIPPLENLSKIPTPGVATNSKEWHPCNEMMSSLLPSVSFQDAHHLRPLGSPSSLYSGGVATSTNLKVTLQKYQNISDTRMNIQGVANLTDQDVALPEAKLNSLEGISLARADSPPQTRNPDRNSGKRLQRHSTRSVSIMRKWFDEKLAHPYPCSRELIKLSKKTHLFIDQVNTWFSNERQRRSKGKGIQRVEMTLKMKNKLPDDSVRVFKAWVDNHSGNSRPTTTEKKFLAQKAELKLQQVSDWFGNYRKKQSQPLHQEVQEDHECFIEMRGRLEMADFNVQEPGNVAEFQDQYIGVVFQPEKNHHDPKHVLDSWDEKWLLSSLNTLLDHSQVEARREARTLNQVGNDCQP